MNIHESQAAAGRALETHALLERLASVDRLRRVTGLNVVGTYPIVPFSGGPEGAGLYLILPTDAERADAWPNRKGIADAVRALLREGGFPSSAVATVDVGLASQPAIEAAGGPAKFFR